MRVAYWSAENFEAELEQELKVSGASILKKVDRLFIVECKTAPRAFWAQNIWLDPQEIEIQSVGDGAKKLRALGQAWALASVAHHRRAQLIQAELKSLRGTTKDKPVAPYSPLPHLKPGTWTLLTPSLILASSTCTAPIANGEMKLIESTEPPSRAYLKLWEFFTLQGMRPNTGDTCIDLGSSPGGWTWVLAELGANVISVDKAELDEKLLSRRNIKVIQRDAFTLKPEEIGPVEWLFSDVICEPRRLCELVETWNASGLAGNFVCTVKFKGKTDYDSLSRLLKIPLSGAIHLTHNKHEFTWFKLKK